jgi:hypothetical protein
MGAKSYKEQLVKLNTDFIMDVKYFKFDNGLLHLYKRMNSLVMGGSKEQKRKDREEERQGEGGEEGAYS